MLSHLGFSAWITCEDKPLPEFEITASSNRITCWIPSKEGKAFVVHWRDEGSKVDTAAYLTLDGFVCAGRFLFGEGHASRSGVRTSVSSERPFIFSKVDDGMENSQLHIKSDGKVGMIILRIKRVKRGGGRKPNEVQVIPEQVRGKRKRGDDCVGFGSERPAEFQQPSTWTVEPYDKTNPGSYITFVFRYRSPEFLEAQGIMTLEPELISPTTPLSDVSTLPSSHPSPRGSRHTNRSVSGASGISDCSEPLPSTPLDYTRHIDRYPGEGLFWFQDDQPTDIAQHLYKKSKTNEFTYEAI